MNLNQIKIVRFKNGDTIICGLTQADNELLLTKPMQISMLPVVGKKGIQSMSIYMQEWLEYAKESVFKIPADVIMLTATPEDEMVQEYTDALEKNELHRVQRDFDKISKNYEEYDDEEDDNSSTIGYNQESYDEDEDSEYNDEDDYEEEKPD